MAALAALLLCTNGLQGVTLRPALLRPAATSQPARASCGGVGPFARLAAHPTRLEGRGQAQCTLPPGPLASYLMDREASDHTLLSAVKVEESSEGSGAYNCELAPIKFLTLTVTPLMIMSVERDATEANEVVVRTLKGNVRIGDQVHKAADIGGLNTIRWRSRADDSWDLECKIELELSLDVPGLQQMPRLARRAWISSSRTVLHVAARSAARQLVQGLRQSYSDYGESVQPTGSVFRDGKARRAGDTRV